MHLLVGFAIHPNDCLKRFSRYFDGGNRLIAAMSSDCGFSSLC